MEKEGRNEEREEGRGRGGRGVSGRSREEGGKIRGTGRREKRAFSKRAHVIVIT